MRIILTGGGTAGHITPNIALIPELKKLGYEVHYIGTSEGMERQLIEPLGIPYHSIHAGKLRRYLDVKNFTDTIQILRGFTESLGIIRKIKPNVVFSKGGFVSCPVVWASWFHRIPVIIHESDMTPGLANKLSIPFAGKICYTFPETRNYLPGTKAVLTGLPVRGSLLQGDAQTGKKICGFNDEKPILMVIGGSLGSEVLNNAIRASLNRIINKFQVCHICGKNGIEPNLNQVVGYKQFEYINQELPHIMAMADLAVSRAGATTLFELLALKKPNLLIPLSKQASRGDQILNARSFAKQGFSKVLPEEELNPDTLITALTSVYDSRRQYIKAMNQSQMKAGVQSVLNVIQSLTSKSS